MVSKMVDDKLQTRGSGTLSVGMSDRFGIDQMPCLIEHNFKNTCIWINEPSMHVW